LRGLSALLDTIAYHEVDVVMVWSIQPWQLARYTG
jgi:hypothetical protein